jgi:hypothetical protein
MARKMGVRNKHLTAEKGLVLDQNKTRVDWGTSRKICVPLDPQLMGVEWGVARLMGVGVAKAEMNKTVHMCSNQWFTVDLTPKLVPPALLSA